MGLGGSSRTEGLTIFLTQDVVKTDLPPHCLSVKKNLSGKWHLVWPAVCNESKY